jgi:CheY-like chemotaxis protein
MVTYLGHQVFEAAHGREALDFLSAHPDVDVILLDMHMAHLDGFAVLAWLRSQPACREIPVVCVSAHALREDREKALLAGANGYVVKPFRRKDLIAALDAVLREVGTLPEGSSIAPV